MNTPCAICGIPRNEHPKLGEAAHRFMEPMFVVSLDTLPEEIGPDSQDYGAMAMGKPPAEEPAPKCAGPNVSALDCPLHDPRQGKRIGSHYAWTPDRSADPVNGPTPEPSTCGISHHTGCACHEAQHAEALAAKDEEIARLREVNQKNYGRWVKAEDEIARLRERLYRAMEANDKWVKWAGESRCIYCETVFRHDPLRQEDADEEKKAHILVCEKHPLAALTARVKALEDALREALDEWRTADEDMHFELVGGKYTEEERLTELRALLTGGTDD